MVSQKLTKGYESLGMTSDGFEGDFAETWATKFSLLLMGGWATPITVQGRGERIPIGVRENLIMSSVINDMTQTGKQWKSLTIVIKHGEAMHSRLPRAYMFGQKCSNF